MSYIIYMYVAYVIHVGTHVHSNNVMYVHKTTLEDYKHFKTSIYITHH